MGDAVRHLARRLTAYVFDIVILAAVLIGGARSAHDLVAGTLVRRAAA